ncbi:flippase [Haladaptatus sp. NG-SE-30]
MAEESVNALPESSSDHDNLFGSVRSVTNGALFYIVSYGATTLLGFVLNIVLTRGLGPAFYGMFVYGKRIVSALLMFVNLGSDVSSIKYLSANKDDHEYQNRMLGLSFVTTFVGSIVVGLLLFVFAPSVNNATLDEPLFTQVLQVFALVIPFKAMTKIATCSFKGLELPRLQALNQILGSVLQLSVIAVAILVGYSLFGVTVGFMIAGVLLFFFSLGLLWTRTHLRPSWPTDRDESIEFYNFSIPLTISRTGSLLYNQIDIFMIGFFLTSADVGYYNIATLLSGIIAIPLVGFNQLFPSVASRLYADDNYEALQSISQIITRWSITISLILAVPIFLYRYEILVLFGKEFSAGATILSLFVLGTLVNAAAGPSNDILTMTDHQYVVLLNHWLFGIANVVLNYYFIQMFGLIGAALATANVLALVNITRVLEVWILEDIFTYSNKIWKPISAIALAAPVMYLCQFVLSGVSLLVAGGAIGVVTYAAILYAFGIEQRDKEIIRYYVTELA